MKKAAIAVPVLLLCACALLIWQQQKLLKMDQVKLRDLAAQVEAMREENELLAKARIDSAELQRLRAEQAELPRLRNELTQLRRQVKEAAAKQKEVAKPAATEKTGQQTTAPFFETYEATNHAVMAWKQTLVTGGWTTKPGRRVVVFSRPESVRSENNTSQILVQSQIIEVPEEVLAQVGLGTLRSEDKQSSAQLLLSPEQAEGILKQFESNEQVKTLSKPRVQTSDGVPATIAVGENRPLPSGEQVFVGKTIHLSPQVSADGESLDLSVASELRIPHKQDE